MAPKSKGAKKEIAKHKSCYIKSNEKTISSGNWLMTFDAPFKIILSARIFAAFLIHITDCDETFNYWEPTHYFIFNSGFQTWEYAPTYALRSYLYILIHVVPAYIYQLFFSVRKIMLFYMIRCMLGLFCSACEIYFYRVIHKKFGSTIAKYYLAISVFSPGMFIASAAYLPSSFSMYMTFLSIGSWYNGNLELAIFTTAISTLLSWPFSGLIGFPLACDVIFLQKKYNLFIKWCFISLLTILGYQIFVDSYIYGKFIIAPMNIVFYNMFTNHGPDLYGTEHWSFYIYNGILNFNVAFILTVIAPFGIFFNKIISMIVYQDSKQYTNIGLNLWVLYLSPFYLWLTVFIAQPHKEERFLFPIYPLLSLTSAVALKYYIPDTINIIQVISSKLNMLTLSKLFKQFKDVAYIPFFVLFVLLGLSRCLLLIKGYHGPLDIYAELSNENLTLPKLDIINVCAGKEWHRFPTSFFLPDQRWKMHFIRSEFRGLLPGKFQNDSLSKVVEKFNDQNKEELDKYSDINLCHFLVDLNNNLSSEFEPNYSELKTEWSIVKSVFFLNNQKTKLLFRTLYIPFIWEDNVYFSSYNLLIRNQIEEMGNINITNAS